MVLDQFRAFSAKIMCKLEILLSKIKWEISGLYFTKVMCYVCWFHLMLSHFCHPWGTHWGYAGKCCFHANKIWWDTWTWVSRNFCRECCASLVKILAFFSIFIVLPLMLKGFFPSCSMFLHFCCFGQCFMLLLQE